MKRILIVLMALVFAFGFSQCKKAETTETGSGIKMVVMLDNGAKTSFTDAGAISWGSNEIVYVFVNGVCRGSLTNGAGGGNSFSGNLTYNEGLTMGNAYDFYFYYLGTDNTKNSISAGDDEFTMDFSDQDGTLANLGKVHFGCGLQKDLTLDESISASAAMKTLVSMALFNTSGMAESDEKVYFYGSNVNSTITVTFSEGVPTYTYGGAGSYICAGTPKENAYVMLVPNHDDGTSELATDFTFVSKRTTGAVTDVFNYGIIGGRFYCANGTTSSPIATNPVSYYQGTLRGEFTINSSNDKVHFSQGNLQFTRESTSDAWSTGVWSFKDNQYDKDAADKNVGTDYANKSVINYFGWGTSGYDNGNTYYYPYNTSVGTDTQGYGYGPTDGSSYIISLTGTADWGYNKIINGGNANEQWRTPSSDEWVYMLKTRKVIVNSISKDSYGEGVVMGKSGLLILPDNWDGSLFEGFKYGKSSWLNSINEDTSPTWSELEAAGVVFLPIAGNRTGTNEDNATTAGYYWSSTPYSNKVAYGLFISSNTEADLTSKYSYNRNLAYLVRLVR